MPKQYGIHGRKVSPKKVVRVLKHFGGKVGFLGYIPRSRLVASVHSNDGVYYRRWDKSGKIVWMFYPFNLPAEYSQRVKEAREGFFNTSPLEDVYTKLIEEGKGGSALTTFDAMPNIGDFSPI